MRFNNISIFLLMGLLTPVCGICADCPTSNNPPSSAITIGAKGYDCTNTTAYYPIINSNVTTCTKCNDSHAYLVAHTSTYGNCTITYKTCDCIPDYYGTLGKCTRCPSNGITGAAGKTSVTDCFIGGNFSDATGSGKYTDLCYYTE